MIKQLPLIETETMDVKVNSLAEASRIAEGALIVSLKAQRDADQAIYEAETKALQDEIEALRTGLQEAIACIKVWHNMGTPEPAAEKIWELYQHSPEMQRINAAINASGKDYLEQLKKDQITPEEARKTLKWMFDYNRECDENPPQWVYDVMYKLRAISEKGG